MTLLDDTCDGCGSRFDPMGDPLLTKHPEIGPYAVFCRACEKLKVADIERLRAIGKAAYEAPWRADDAHVWVETLDHDPEEGPTVYVNGGLYANQRNTAAFIATARNEWDALLDRLEAAEAKVARVEELARSWIDFGCGLDVAHGETEDECARQALATLRGDA